MLSYKTKYCLSDVCITPAMLTNINSRSECNSKYANKYPIFCSPMSCVCDEKNYDTLYAAGLLPILPRTVPYKIRLDFLFDSQWVAFSEEEFTNLFCEMNHEKCVDLNLRNKVFKICIDTANGHRANLYYKINEAKELADKFMYKLVIMAGNIASADTYRWIAKNSKVDYLRVCIGTGNVCITSTQTTVHYPTASLLAEIQEEKIKLLRDNADNIYYPSTLPKIVCDGGISNYSNAIAALALGADYVMMGSIIASSDESCAKIINKDGVDYKVYYGMSTKKAQAEINAAKEVPIITDHLKTSEGTEKLLIPSGSIYKWIDNFDSYLKSAMSYTNCKTLSEFTSGKVQLVIKSPETNQHINK